MIPAYREAFNANYRLEQYERLLNRTKKDIGYTIDFKVSETPIFMPKNLKEHLKIATQEILIQLQSDHYLEQSHQSIPQNCFVPHQNAQPDFMAIDFAICKDTDEQLIPQLIELQSFPSLFFFQVYLNQLYREYYHIDNRITNFFHGYTENDYLTILRNLIVADHNPEHVILLEIEPEKQKTRIDFTCCERMMGIKTVCLTKIIKRDRTLFYKHEGREIPIKRIYNRVIFDELQMRTDLKPEFNMVDDVDVEWVGHPNWFFRISKFSLPFLKSKYVPKTFFLHELEAIPSDLQNYVLKPLFSFAGLGVVFDVKPEHIHAIPASDRSNYILMQKIQYEPLIKTLDIPAKVEVRMMIARNTHTNQLEILTNLIRLSKGKMMGVDFNREKIWVGGSVAYFEE